MHKNNSFRIKYISLLCCGLLLFSGCGETETFTPIEPEATHMHNMENSNIESSNTDDSAQESVTVSNPAQTQTGNNSPGNTSSESGTNPSGNTSSEHGTNSSGNTNSITEITLPHPGVLSMENLLRTALLPVGNTMYIWGGGWNEADTGAGIEALTLGVSEQWATYAAAQDAAYNYKNTRYRIHDGLDCSGYMGWLIYNVFETKNSTEETDGYVMSSTSMAETFANYGWGEYLTADITEWKPGDICSMSGHVWMSLGMCGDGSVVVLHSSPPGVRICGTRLANGESSQAIALAEKYMKTYYPDWFERYPACDVSYNYLSDSKIMRWNTETLEDSTNIRKMTAEEVLEFLFE